MEDESLALDPHLDYNSVEGVSAEVKERLSRVRPTSIVSIWHTCLLITTRIADITCVLGRGKAHGGYDAVVLDLPAETRETSEGYQSSAP